MLLSMTTREQESINNQETRMWGLRDEIIAELNVNGGDPTRRFQKMGYEMSWVPGGKDRVGWSSLTLDVKKRGWSRKFVMDGYPVEEKPTISQLLAEYASIEDDDFKALEPRQLRVSQLRPKSLSLSDDELAQYYHRLEEEKRRYVENNKPRLLQGLIESLKNTLQNLQTQFPHTSDVISH